MEGSTEQEGVQSGAKPQLCGLRLFVGSGQGRGPAHLPGGCASCLKKPREDEQSPDWGGKEEGREGVWEGVTCYQQLQ